MGQTREEQRTGTPVHTSTPSSSTAQPRKQKAAAKRFEAEQQSENKASQMKTTLYVVADILKEQRAQLIAGAPPGAQIGLTELHVAVSSKRNGKPIDGAARRVAFDTAMLLVEPKIEQYRKELEDPEWLSDNVTERLARLRDQVMFTEAAHRTKSAVRIGDNHIYEDSSNPKETALALRAELPRVIATLKLTNDLLLRDHEIEEAALRRLAGDPNKPAAKINSIAELMGVLNFADGLLTLTDDEFAKRLDSTRGYMPTVSAVGDVVKAMVQLFGGAAAVSTYVASRFARLRGNVKLADTLLSYSHLTTTKVGDLISVIEAVYGILQLCHPDSTWGQRLNGAVTAATGIGAVIEIGAEGTAGTVAAAAAGGWELYKWAVETFYSASLGITSGLMEAPLTKLAAHGSAIAQLMSEAINSHLLRQKETEPEKQAALRNVHSVRVSQLQQRVDYLISDTLASGEVRGMAKHPGAHKILNEAFAPLRPFRGKMEEQLVMQAAKLALERVQFIVLHAPDIRIAAAEGKGWSDAAKGIEAKQNKKVD